MQSQKNCIKCTAQKQCFELNKLIRINSFLFAETTPLTNDVFMGLYNIAKNNQSTALFSPRCRLTLGTAGLRMFLFAIVSKT